LKKVKKKWSNELKHATATTKMNIVKVRAKPKTIGKADVNGSSRSVIPNLFLMHSSLCAFWNFSFLPYKTFVSPYGALVPLLWSFYSSPVQVHRLILTAIGSGTMVFIDHNNWINKSGTKSKTNCCQIMALKFVNKIV